MRILIAALLLAVPVQAQVRESIEVNILELDVAVIDRRGKLVDGLTGADFEVQIGSRRMEVSNFFAVQRGAIVDERGEAPRRDSPAGQTIIPTSLVILIDDTRLGPFAKKRAIDALKEYVAANVGPSTTAMIARYDGSLDVRTRPSERAGPLIVELDRMAKKPVRPIDSDRRLILRRIDQVLTLQLGGPPAHRIEQQWGEVVAHAERETSEIERTLRVLGEVVRLAGAFEGRKSVLYVSEGLPVSGGAEVFDYWERATRVVGSDTIPHGQEIARRIYDRLSVVRYDRSREFEKLARQAQAANVMFYGIDAGGVRGLSGRGVEETSSVVQIDTLVERSNLEGGVRLVAESTGGRFIANQNDLGQALSVLSEQFTTFYSLGVRAPVSTKLTRVRVAVKGRPELRVITARHRKPLSPDEQLERSVRSRLYLLRAENPLAAEVGLGSAASVDGRCVVPLNVSVPRAEKESRLQLHFALLDELQQESDIRKVNIAADPGDASHLMSLGLKPGKYVLSLAVADRTSGQTSYLQHQIDCR